MNRLVFIDRREVWIARQIVRLWRVPLLRPGLRSGLECWLILKIRVI